MTEDISVSETVRKQIQWYEVERSYELMDVVVRLTVNGKNIRACYVLRRHLGDDENGGDKSFRSSH